MKICSWKTRASCGQPTSGLHFQFEFHITVLRYMGRVSVKQFVTNCNIKNMRFFLCTVYVNCSTTSSSQSSMVMAGSSIVSCPRTFVFLRLMITRTPQSLQAWEKQTVHLCLQLLLGVGRHCCIVREQHVSDEGFKNLCLGSEAAKIEKPAIWSGLQTDSLSPSSVQCSFARLPSSPLSLAAGNPENL